MTVPNVIGQAQAAAQELLENAGLPVGIETAYSEDVEAGLVISQSRTPGERVRTGSLVSLVVSAGTQWFYMDSYVGWTEAEALAAIQESGAKDVSVEYVQSGTEAGMVVAQSPEMGWQSKSDPVVIAVSGESVLMPSLMGLDLEGAKALIESEGLTVGSIVEGYSADAPVRTVIAQSVAADTKVLAGTAVDLTVSERREAVYYPDSRFTVVVPLESLLAEVTLVTPSGTEVIAYTGELPMGTHAVELSSTEKGMHTVRVYLDGVLMDTTELLFE